MTNNLTPEEQAEKRRQLILNAGKHPATLPLLIRENINAKEFLTARAQADLIAYDRWQANYAAHAHQLDNELVELLEMFPDMDEIQAKAKAAADIAAQQKFKV